MKRAFSLVELLVALAIVGVLFGLVLGALGKVRVVTDRAACSNGLRQLGVATQLYLADHDNEFFPFSKTTPEGYKLWYFGLERASSGGEGNRELDVTQSYLYPYISQIGGIEICPSFPYGSALWKPKFKGASYAYGYNTFLPGRNLLTIQRPSQVILFGDCAQVNTFQAPASSSNPMLEEFYMIENWYKAAHFRHGALAQFVFVDGHVEALPMHPGTGDSRLPEANVGRITPAGSMKYLW